MVKLKCLLCNKIHKQFIPVNEYKKICDNPEHRIKTFCFSCQTFTNHIISYEPG